MIDRGIGRDGYPICNMAGEQIGVVTSGSPAPFLKKNIALGLCAARELLRSTRNWPSKSADRECARSRAEAVLPKT